MEVLLTISGFWEYSFWMQFLYYLYFCHLYKLQEGKKEQKYEAFSVLHAFLLLKHSVIHKLLSPCWNFHFCGSKQTPFKGGGTLSPVSATEVVTRLLFLLFNLANIKIRFFLVWDFSLDSSCRLSSWMFAAE